MKTTALILMMALFFTSCNSQTKNNSLSANGQGEEEKQVQNQPKVSWKVDKKVDENGNVIRYDSVYTWSYSNVNGDSVTVNVDSVMGSFHSYFNQRFPSMWDKSFVNPINEDSLIQRDFFMDDYFHKRWEDEFFNMDEMFRRFDSIRNQFFIDSYPGLIKPIEKKKDSYNKI
ncbi:MAG: hypothetical protein K9J13_09610 [Saprospiraceae bacterium]|nr:hypothetical protein [Saprospiraceae bacterium]